MPRYLLGVLLLLLVSVSEMQAQGDVVLYIEGKPVYRSESKVVFTYKQLICSILNLIFLLFQISQNSFLKGFKLTNFFL